MSTLKYLKSNYSKSGIPYSRLSAELLLSDSDVAKLGLLERFEKGSDKFISFDHFIKILEEL